MGCVLLLASPAALSTPTTGTAGCDSSKDKRWLFYVEAESICEIFGSFFSHLLTHTCGSALSPSPPLILAVPLISIIRCFCLAWHPTAGILLAGVMQLYTHTCLFYPECSFSLAITQSSNTGANRTY